MILGLILGVLGAVAVFAALFIAKRQLASSIGSERDALMAQVAPLTTELDQLLSNGGQFIAKGQVDFIANQLQSAQTELEQEKTQLQEIETKLDEAQKQVEQKESVHQDLKSSREEDEMKLQELMGRYQDISNESISLEQKLASSMKNLDLLMSEVTLSADQRAVFEELSNSMTNAGSRLRDLLTEYAAVHERLELLQQQHQDLETEYTRLVEQQLGE